MLTKPIDTSTNAQVLIFQLPYGPTRAMHAAAFKRVIAKDHHPLPNKIAKEQGTDYLHAWRYVRVILRIFRQTVVLTGRHRAISTGLLVEFCSIPCEVRCPVMSL